MYIKYYIIVYKCVSVSLTVVSLCVFPSDESLGRDLACIKALLITEEPSNQKTRVWSPIYIYKTNDKLTTQR